MVAIDDLQQQLGKALGCRSVLRVLFENLGLDVERKIAAARQRKDFFESRNIALPA